MYLEFLSEGVESINTPSEEIVEDSIHEKGESEVTEKIVVQDVEENKELLNPEEIQKFEEGREGKYSSHF